MKQINKYGAIKVISRWLEIIPQILVQWRVFLYYAFVLTIVSAVSNRWTYACHGHSGGFWCYWYNSNNTAYISSILLSFFTIILVLGMFSFDFYSGLITNTPIKCKKIYAISKEKIKSGMVFLGASIIFIILLGVIAYIINPPGLEDVLNYILHQWNFSHILLHGANENWQIELIFFTIAFIGIMIPLLFMRCFAVVAYWFNEKRAPFTELYEKTFSRAYVGIFCFLLLALLCTVQHLSIINYFNKFVENHNYLIVAFFSEYCNNLLILLYVSLFLLLSQAEYLQLKVDEADKTNIDIEKSAAELSDFVISTDIKTDLPKTQNTSSKSSRKKKSIRKAKNVSAKGK